MKNQEPPFEFYRGALFDVTTEGDIFTITRNPDYEHRIPAAELAQLMERAFTGAQYSFDELAIVQAYMNAPEHLQYNGQPIWKYPASTGPGDRERFAYYWREFWRVAPEAVEDALMRGFWRLVRIVKAGAR